MSERFIEKIKEEVETKYIEIEHKLQEYDLMYLYSTKSNEYVEYTFLRQNGELTAYLLYNLESDNCKISYNCELTKNRSVFAYLSTIKKKDYVGFFSRYDFSKKETYLTSNVNTEITTRHNLDIAIFFLKKLLLVV